LKKLHAIRKYHAKMAAYAPILTTIQAHITCARAQMAIRGKRVKTVSFQNSIIIFKLTPKPSPPKRSMLEHQLVSKQWHMH